MIDNPFALQERRKLLELAREYRHKGYRVIVSPKNKDLPSFLKDKSPDLFVRKGDRCVIVEIKSKMSLANSSDLPELAGLVHNRPGWRFDLVVTNPKIGSRPVIRKKSSKKRIHGRLSTAQGLAAEGSIEAGLLSAWSAGEALLRKHAKVNGVKGEFSSSLRVIKELYTIGAVTEDEYSLLRKSLSDRNAIVHGFEAQSLTKRQLDGLLKVFERLSLDK